MKILQNVQDELESQFFPKLRLQIVVYLYFGSDEIDLW